MSFDELAALGELRDQLRLLSELPVPLQGRLAGSFETLTAETLTAETLAGGGASLAAVEEALAVPGVETGEIVVKAHQALRRIDEVTAGWSSRSLVRLIGETCSLGIGLSWQGAGAARVAPPTGIDSPLWGRSPVADAEITRWVINHHAAPGSAFRGWLAQQIRSHLSFVGDRPGEPLTGARFLRTLRYLSGARSELILRDPGVLLAERQTYLDFLPRLIALTLDLHSRGLPVLGREEEESLVTLREGLAAIPQPPRREGTPTGEEVAAGLEGFLGGPSGDPEGFAARIGRLRETLLDAIFDRPDLTHLRIAVVGYGMNLDLIRFFVDLGLSVTAVEKFDSAEDWAEVKAADLDTTDPFPAMIGLPELAVPSNRWPQLTPGQVLAALGHPPDLRVVGHDMPGLAGTFDLVVIAAIIDEARATVASLAKEDGGVVWAENFPLRPGMTTRDATSFIAEAQAREGLSFEPLFDEPFSGGERVLPSDYGGNKDPRHVYVVQRRLDVATVTREAHRILTDPTATYTRLGKFRLIYDSLTGAGAGLHEALIQDPETFVATLREALGGTPLDEDRQLALMSVVRYDPHRSIDMAHRRICLLPAVYRLALSDLLPSCELEFASMTDSTMRFLSSLSLDPWGNKEAPPESSAGRNRPYHELIARQLLPRLAGRQGPIVIHAVGDGTGRESPPLFKELDAQGPTNTIVVSSDLTRDLYFASPYFASRGDLAAVFGSGGELVSVRRRGVALRDRHRAHQIEAEWAHLRAAAAAMKVRGGDRWGREEIDGIQVRRVHLVNPNLLNSDWYRSGRLHFAEADMFNDRSLIRAALPTGGDASIATLLNVIDAYRFPEREGPRNALAAIGRSVENGGFVVAGRTYQISPRSPRFGAVVSVYRRVNDRLVPVTDLDFASLQLGPDSMTSFPEGIDLDEGT